MRVISRHTKIDTLFDSGSKANLISEDLVNKLNIETIQHHKPYPLVLIRKNTNFHVTESLFFILQSQQTSLMKLN